jgi:3-methylcrotonyl-CoA carboxylase alpha subunit
MRRCISAARNRPKATCGVAAIIEAARRTGAQAIHPGYGFLSENPDFVDAVAKGRRAGLHRPSAKAIRAMGLKDAAKALMEEAGVPVVPGYHGENQDRSICRVQGGRHRLPGADQGRAGGGGKGMRKVAIAGRFHGRAGLGPGGGGDGLRQRPFL